jgi:two-component system, cell cycle response regulator DivK
MRGVPLAFDVPMLAAEAHQLDILYIEDSTIDSVLMELIARRSRCNNITSVMTAELGLQLVSECKPRLILMDIYLPGMDGLQAVRRLKTDAGTRDIPVIVVSSDTSAELSQRAQDAGCDEFFAKPFDINKIISTLDYYLRPEFDGA